MPSICVLLWDSRQWLLINSVRTKDFIVKPFQADRVLKRKAGAHVIIRENCAGNAKCVDELGMKSTDKASNEAEAVKEAVRDTPVGLSTADNLWQLLGLVFVLIIVLVAAYYTTKYVGNIKLGQMKNSNFTAIDSYRLSPNKLLQIVKIGNKYVVIAITKDNINFITELDEDEVLLREDQPVERPDFKKILEKLRNKK